MTKLIIITDANEGIGLGHLTRQITLAKQAQQKGLKVIFFGISSLIAKYCSNEGLSYQLETKWESIVSQLLHMKPDVVIIDVHQKDFSQLKQLSRGAFKLILMVSEVGYNFIPFGDHLIRVGSDMNIWEYTSDYLSRDKITRLHSGRAWMIFRDEFRNIDTSDNKKKDQILIAHGGTDPFNLTEFSLKALEETKSTWNIAVMITSQFSKNEIIHLLSEKSKHSVRVIVDSKNVAEVMYNSTVAIINGGNIRYELCLTRTPFVAISFQQAQYDCTEEITKIGVGYNCGHYQKIKYEDVAASVQNMLYNMSLRNEMMGKMEKLFDHYGTTRILELCVNGA